jgi:hypothetical protein
VGVWVKGPASVLHPLVGVACLRFAFSSLLMDRAVSTDGGAAFLLLLCPEGVWAWVGWPVRPGVGTLACVTLHLPSAPLLTVCR